MDIFSRSGDIRDQSLKWSKIDRNFARFWPPNFFVGATPEFLEWDYKIQPDSDHVTKFQGDRSRELGERLAKQKKEDTYTGKTLACPELIVPGGLTSNYKIYSELKLKLKTYSRHKIQDSVSVVKIDRSANFACLIRPTSSASQASSSSSSSNNNNNSRSADATRQSWSMSCNRCYSGRPNSLL